MLALHGFPDLPRTFRHQMVALAAAGYRVVAPRMRGHPPTAAPAEASYEQHLGDGAGHFVPRERPELVTGVMLDFLAA